MFALGGPLAPFDAVDLRNHAPDGEERIVFGDDTLFELVSPTSSVGL